MASLSNKHKTFIVIRLACYETPSEVAEAVKEEFGMDIDRAQVSYYNPKSLQGSKQLAQKWKDLFDETRQRFKKEIEDIPIANKAYRLKKLQRNMEHLERMRNYKGANETIEQAAKEVGGTFTNKREHDITGLMGSIDMSQLSDQQLQRIANGEHPIAVLANEGESPAGDSS